MTSNCTDSSNIEYEAYWFGYFVSVGYITTSDSSNPYAPYGKCTPSLLWLTYLNNAVHFCFLSSGIFYLLNVHRNQTGFLWPFITWLLSLFLLASSIVLFVFRNIATNLFSLLIIGSQLSMLIVLWGSIFIVIAVTFSFEHRYQRCLFLFIIILLIVEIGCIIVQVIITLHCLFNLKLMSTSLDYAYWSAIISAGGIILSTLLLDYIFIWSRKRNVSSRVGPVSVAVPSQQRMPIEDRCVSPIDSQVLEDFLDEPEEAPHRIYNNKDRTRCFRVCPKNQPIVGVRPPNVLQLQDLDGHGNIHNLMSESEG